MNTILLFFKFLSDLALKVAEWAISIPGQIVLFVSAFFSAVTSALTFFSSHTSTILNFLSSATSKVASLCSLASSNPYGNLLAYCLSLDLAVQYLIAAGSVFVGLVSLIIVGFFCYLITAFIVPFTLQLAFKIVSIFSGGFVKV